MGEHLWSMIQAVLPLPNKNDMRMHVSEMSRHCFYPEERSSVLCLGVFLPFFLHGCCKRREMAEFL